MKQGVLIVFGKDRAGIIAKITGILYKNRCNLEDISMTILEGQFASVMVVCLPAGAQKEAMTALIQKDLKKWSLSAVWKDLKGPLHRGEKHPKGHVTHLVSAVGPDKTGIVYKTSRLLYQYGLNITDLNTKILGKGKSSLYAMMLEVDIPKSFQVKKLEKQLTGLGRSLGIDFRIKPIERFEA